jgi:Glycosyltransferase family 87
VLLCFAQGQDSLLLLLVVVFSFTALRRDRDFAAGCWLGLGLFKFQIVLPLAFVLVLSRSGSGRREFAKGLGLIALAFAGLSAAIAGGSVFTVYPKFLIHVQAQAYSGIFPQAMANFRGLIFIFFHRDQTDWAVAGVCLLSAASLTKILIDWKRARATSPARPVGTSRDDIDAAFANTIIFALLVSYHLNPHDLSLLLLAIAVLLRCTLAQKSVGHPAKWVVLVLSAILVLPPMHLWGLKADAYALVALPLALLFVSTGRPKFMQKNQGEN